MTDLAGARTTRLRPATRPRRCSNGSATRSCRSAKRPRCHRSCTRHPTCWRSRPRRCSVTTGCVSVVPTGSPSVGDWFTVDIVGEPIVIVRDKAGERAGHVGRLPAPGDAGVRRRRQLDDVQVPVPPLELRPRRPTPRRAGDGADDRLRQVRVRSAAAAGRALGGIRLRQLRPGRRAAGPDARALHAVARQLRPRRTPCARARSPSRAFRGTGR